MNLNTISLPSLIVFKLNNYSFLKFQIIIIIISIISIIYYDIVIWEVKLFKV
jgi:hypothetical protein